MTAPVMIQTRYPGTRTYFAFHVWNPADNTLTRAENKFAAVMLCASMGGAPASMPQLYPTKWPDVVIFDPLDEQGSRFEQDEHRFVFTGTLVNFDGPKHLTIFSFINDTTMPWPLPTEAAIVAAGEAFGFRAMIDHDRDGPRLPPVLRAAVPYVVTFLHRAQDRTVLKRPPRTYRAPQNFKALYPSTQLEELVRVFAFVWFGETIKPTRELILATAAAMGIDAGFDASDRVSSKTRKAVRSLGGVRLRQKLPTDCYTWLPEHARMYSGGWETQKKSGNKTNKTEPPRYRMTDPRSPFYDKSFSEALAALKAEEAEGSS